MIFEPLRRSLVRWLRPRATSVAHPIDLSLGGVHMTFDPASFEIRPLPPGPYVDPHQRGTEPEPIGSTHVRGLDRPGIKPPPDPADEGWTWSAWKRELDAGALPGWAVCRFANRIGPDHADFVFGIVRGSFGIWRQPFNVCAAGTDSTERILTFLTHLPSGLGIGIFSDREVAAEAAMLADRIWPAWETLDPNDSATWGDALERTRAAWSGIGVRYLDDAHCHDRSGNTFGIYSRTAKSMMAGRPEKLS